MWNENTVAIILAIIIINYQSLRQIYISGNIVGFRLLATDDLTRLFFILLFFWLQNKIKEKFRYFCLVLTCLFLWFPLLLLKWIFNIWKCFYCWISVPLFSKYWFLFFRVVAISFFSCGYLEENVNFIFLPFEIGLKDVLKLRLKDQNDLDLKKTFKWFRRQSCLFAFLISKSFYISSLTDFV